YRRPRNPSSPKRLKMESGNVFSSHSSRWGWTSAVGDFLMCSRSSSWASVKYIGMECRPERAEGCLRYDSPPGSPSGTDARLGGRLGSVIKKRRKKMRKHKHKKMLKKTRWARRAHA